MNKLKTVVFRHQQYHNNLLGQDFANVVRQATAKTVPERSEVKNMAVVRAINDRDAEMGLVPADISSVLRRRLKMENPHKQYLAVLLTKDVLLHCARRVRSVYAELLYEIAVVATSPSQPGTIAARKAKQAALEVLRGHERAGAAAFRAAAGLGAGTLQQELDKAINASRNAGDKPSASHVLNQLERFATVAKSHSAVFQDMLNSSEPRKLEESLIKELMTEMEQMKSVLPKLIDKASNLEGVNAEQALAGGMEALDAIEEVFKLYHEVKDGRAKCAKKQQAKESLGTVPSFSFPKAHPSNQTSPRGIPESGANTSGNQTAGGSGQDLLVDDNDPFGLNALQEAFDEAAISKAQGHDPFALIPHANLDPTSPVTPTTPSAAQPFGFPQQVQAPVQNLTTSLSAPNQSSQQHNFYTPGATQVAGYSPRGQHVQVDTNPFSEVSMPLQHQHSQGMIPVASQPVANIRPAMMPPQNYVQQQNSPRYQPPQGAMPINELKNLNPFGNATQSQQQVPMGQPMQAQAQMQGQMQGQMQVQMQAQMHAQMHAQMQAQMQAQAQAYAHAQAQAQAHIRSQSSGFDEPPAFGTPPGSPMSNPHSHPNQPTGVGNVNWDALIAERTQGAGTQQSFQSS